MSFLGDALNNLDIGSILPEDPSGDGGDTVNDTGYQVVNFLQDTLGSMANQSGNAPVQGATGNNPGSSYTSVTRSVIATPPPAPAASAMNSPLVPVAVIVFFFLLL